MNRQIILFLLSGLLALSSLGAQSGLPTTAQLIGTWEVFITTQYGYGLPAVNQTLRFTFYPDGRRFSMVGPGLPDNGHWKVEDELVLVSSDLQPETITKIRTSFFDGKTWRYQILGNTASRYQARKLSATPIVIPQPGLMGNDQTPQRPSSTIIDVGKLIGTWKASSSSGSNFSFVLYPDLRSYVVSGSTSYNASWTVQGDKLYYTPDYLSTVMVTKTLSFDGKKWVYRSLEDGTQYTATKVSATALPLAVTPAAPRPANPPARAGTDPGRTSPLGRSCSCCFGSHKMDCQVCAGAGGHYDRNCFTRYDANGNPYQDCQDIWRHCTAGCEGGKVDCTCCDQRDDGWSNSHAGDRVPNDATLVGAWRGSDGATYTFYERPTAQGKLLAVGPGTDTGHWVIEDGLLKLFRYSTGKWVKYSFDPNWTTRRLSLREQGGYRTLTLEKRQE